MDLSIKMFGEQCFISNTAVLNYALVLAKLPEMEEESNRMFAKAESTFGAIFAKINPAL